MLHGSETWPVKKENKVVNVSKRLSNHSHLSCWSDISAVW